MVFDIHDNATFLADEDGDEAVETEELMTRTVFRVDASSGVAAAWGIHHYLKYWCNAHFSWDTTRIGSRLIQSNTKKIQ